MDRTQEPDVPAGAMPPGTSIRKSDGEAARATLRGLLWIGLVILFLGVAITAGSVAGSDSYGGSGATSGGVVYGWLLVAGGGSALLVALIAYGVMLGTRAARD